MFGVASSSTITSVSMCSLDSDKSKVAFYLISDASDLGLIRASKHLLNIINAVETRICLLLMLLLEPAAY